ncbi:MAG TPA: hypothetical protein VHA77_11350 [Xanthobacteraceae bacterium]|jgi:hypothetical protein|nr:hypothetical protein [Xanthobacteraceae bacterium]
MSRAGTRAAPQGPASAIVPTGGVSDFAGLVKIIEQAPIVVPELATAALNEVLNGVITGEGPTTRGRAHFSRTVDAEDAALCGRILVAAGGRDGAPVTRQEADVLFDIDAAGTERLDDGRFDDLFVKAVAHHALAAAGRPVPPRDIALAPSTPLSSWASPQPFADVDTEILQWIASHVKRKTRPSGSLLAIAVFVIGAAASPMAQSIAALFDLTA